MHSGQAVIKNGCKRPNGPILAGEASVVGITTGARRTACGALNEAKRVPRYGGGLRSGCKGGAAATGMASPSGVGVMRGGQTAVLPCCVDGFRLLPIGGPVALKTKPLNAVMRCRGIRLAGRVISVRGRSVQEAEAEEIGARPFRIIQTAVFSPTLARRIRPINCHGPTFRRCQRHALLNGVKVGNFVVSVSQKVLSCCRGGSRNSHGCYRIHDVPSGNDGMRGKVVSKAICGRMEALMGQRQTTVLDSGGRGRARRTEDWETASPFFGSVARNLRLRN